MLRKLCKYFLLTFLLITNVIGANNNNNNNNKPSVIIVGAGPAGIAAASRLLENDIDDITILEAENRIGGRIHSVKFGDAFVELGAEWCHGEVNNTVYGLVKNLDLLAHGTSTFHLYHSSVKDVKPDFINELYGIYNDVYKGEKEFEGVTLGDYMVQRYNKSIVEYFRNDQEKTKLALDSVDTVKKWILSTEGSFTWYSPSAKSDYTECDGNPVLNWKGRGYRTLLDVLMRKYPNPAEELPVMDKLLLNKEVIKILWDNDKEIGQEVTVECSDGSTYSADHVIVTTSLGVLKHQHETLFYPPLPQEKVTAIEELGIDAVGKIIFHFPVRWWPVENFSDFTFMWTERDIALSAQEYPQGPNEGGISWVTNLMAFYATENNPNVLTAWFCGEFVPSIEAFSEDVVIDGSMFVLNKFLGDKYDNITQPDLIIRHNWYSNPHFRGTYSYQTVASRKSGTSKEIILSQPLTSSSGKQTLLFGGEATHPFYYSTVHGAIETGFREADRLINAYK